MQPRIIQMLVLLQRAFGSQASKGPVSLTSVGKSATILGSPVAQTTVFSDSLSYCYLKQFLTPVISKGLKKDFKKYIRWYCYGKRIRPRSSRAKGQAQAIIKISLRSLWLFITSGQKINCFGS